MKTELWYSVVVRDCHGKVLSRERRRARSFLKQWNELVYTQMSQNSVGTTDTGGTSRTIGSSAINLRMDAPAGTAGYGIRVGTGITAVAIDDHALDTPIGEGAGPGQMNHLVCTVADPAVSAIDCSFLVSRTIVNNSGSPITVREGGVYARTHDGAYYYLCVARDVFGTPQNVPNGGSITVNWTIKVTA